MRAALSWAERLALGAYGAVMRGLQPLLRRKLQRRGLQEPGYLAHMPQRFGFYDEAPPEPGRIWVHAVSLGETRAAAILIASLRTLWPDMRLLLTHSTATGWAQGQSLLRPGDAQAWLPWDTPEATRRFLQHHQPRLGILMETEVWPTLVQACVLAQVPLVLANARLNDKSLRSGLRWALLSRPAYRGLTAVLAQSPDDAARLQQLGAKVQAVLGNLKFDVPPQPDALALAQVWRSQWQVQGQSRPVVMLASTREGEEALWLQALAADADRLAAFRAAGVLWLLVPRHPQRFDEVHAQVAAQGLSVFRRSAWTPDAPDPADQAEKTEVWLGDSLGEMPVYFQSADMTLLGGSFMPLGGQNLIEAAAFGCPVIMGPHTFNFAEAAQNAETAGAAARVADMNGALDQAMAWLHEPSACKRARQKGLDLVAQSRGAAERYAQALTALSCPA
ncbi:3-deoxy-D-manno-octulosonic acid transferase [Limnohabitans sp. 2KL-1]|uniref:3-deoxy-D-manno-octulosonic acid transferase n=1 Tax=Limnohabitans sp. 2KL-1 TaxID=1100699 RepID=UPI001E4E7446|nr:3-deoxy-D-manno-octulosonic acid transferase [Limnohabitans sp. 2KL-1]